MVELVGSPVAAACSIFLADCSVLATIFCVSSVFASSNFCKESATFAAASGPLLTVLLLAAVGGAVGGAVGAVGGAGVGAGITVTLAVGAAVSPNPPLIF